ncbi:hypothetical protein EMCRGX_G011122 [Ephydatia muelleri]
MWNLRASAARAAEPQMAGQRALCMSAGLVCLMRPWPFSTLTQVAMTTEIEDLILQGTLAYNHISSMPAGHGMVPDQEDQ